MNIKINSLIYASSFDVLGFNCSKNEFNYGQSIKDWKNDCFIRFQMIYEFIKSSNFSKIDLDNKLYSDDSIMMKATLRALISIKNNGYNINNLQTFFIEEYIKDYDDLVKSKYAAGNTTLYSLNIIRRSKNINTIKYSNKMGGNGAAMRTTPIGLYFAHDFDKLIETAYIASIVTHNYVLGYMGGIVSALFTSFAINKYPVYSWLPRLIKMNKDGKFDKYLQNDKHIFFDYIQNYYENHFDSRKLAVFRKSDDRLNEILNYNKIKKGQDYYKIGDNGATVIITAYDILLEASEKDKDIDINQLENKNPEFNLDALIFEGCFNSGDSDTIGIVLGAWVGAMGLKFNFNNLKDKQEIIDLYNKLF